MAAGCGSEFATRAAANRVAVIRSLYAMADTLCQRCGVIGFVHRALILHGEMVAIEYTCERCHHVWRDTDERRTPERRATTDRRMATTDRRKHR